MIAEQSSREHAQSDAVEAVRSILIRARDAGASDVHVDPGEAEVVVLFRRDGVLHEAERHPKTAGPRIVARLKALADLLAYRCDVPQEGRIDAARSGAGVEVRVATFPTIHGERAALRLDTGGLAGVATADLAALGLPAAAHAGLVDALSRPDGVILLTGPAGSGKTTTLYTSLRHLAAGGVRRALFTVEDPVERRIPGVTQTQVNAAAGLTFARALRSLLRQDPEVLLVGEIRDRETAQVALEAGLTGHLVASTVHAGTAAAVFARLCEMGVEPYVVTSAVRGVLAQRLVRAKCASCSAGCGACGGTGYSGRRLIAEWLPVTARLRDAILARGDATALAAAAEGLPTLRDEAEALVAAGLTTREEVDRVLGRA